MSITIRQCEWWEQDLGTSILYGVIARRPGGTGRAVLRLLLALVVFAALGYLVYRRTGFRVFTLLPLAALSLSRPRRSDVATGAVPLPFQVVVLVTTGDVTFVPYLGEHHRRVSRISAQIPHHMIERVRQGTRTRHVVLDLVDGRTATVSVGRRKDRVTLVETLQSVIGAPRSVPRSDAPRVRPRHAVPPARRAASS